MMRRRIARWFGRHPFLMSALLILVIAGPGFLRVEQISNRQIELGECVRQTVNQIVARTDALSGPTRDRANALDALILTFRPQINGQPPDRAAIDKAFREYFAASDKYRETLRTHPIPDAPKFNCPN